MIDTKQHPRVGLGVILQNDKGEILVGKRKGSHAAKYSIPGGKLDLGESFEKAAIREIKEETDLTIENPHVIAVTNNLETYKEDGVHFISIILFSNEYHGKLKIMEPEKCEEWIWVNPDKLPEPHFDASRLGIQSLLQKKFYLAE